MIEGLKKGEGWKGGGKAAWDRKGREGRGKVGYRKIKVNFLIFNKLK